MYGDTCLDAPYQCEEQKAGYAVYADGYYYYPCNYAHAYAEEVEPALVYLVDNHRENEKMKVVTIMMTHWATDNMLACWFERPPAVSYMCCWKKPITELTRFQVR